jgi:nucleoside-diphosphate-sugar epimerase
MKKNILLIGGTGVVGSATALSAFDAGYEVHTISLECNPELPKKIKQHICDRNDRSAFRALSNQLNSQVGTWDIVFDIIGSKQRDAEQTCLLFGDKALRVFFLSTTLVYSRTTYQLAPIASSAQLAQTGVMGGYVDSKVGMEDFIQRSKGVAWTILRPYHILGRYSLLGCLPDHNRDPLLVERIKRGEEIVLCEGGIIPLQVVHPKDIATFVLRASERDVTIHRCYNVVNQMPITALEYHEEIARQLGCTLSVCSKSIVCVWDEQCGWELTTFPHVYDVSNVERDLGWVPSIGLRECIADALASPVNDYENFGDIPVHNRMTLFPRPKRVQWLFK